MANFDNPSSSNISYYNAQIYNNNTSTDLECNYNARTSSYILKKASDWMLSIVRFSLPASSIPLFFFRNNTYTVTLYQPSSGVTSQVTLTYIDHESGSVRQPVYSFQNMVDSVNLAFKTAFDNITTTTGGSFLGPTTGSAPLLYYNAENGLFNLYVNTNDVGNVSYDDADINRVEIYFNNLLFKFFQGFYVDDLGNQLTDGKDRRFIINKNPVNTSATGMTIIKQEFENRLAFYELRSIVLKTSMPILDERTSPVATNQSTFTGDLSVSIMADFLPYNPHPRDYRSRNIYVPSNFRYSHFTTSDSLKTINFEAFWEGEDGNLNRIYIQPGEAASVKFMFIRKKDIY
jgi:hypothetical protein